MAPKDTKRKQELMRQRQRKDLTGKIVVIGLFLFVFGMISFLMFSTSQASPTPAAVAASALDGKTLLEQRCNDCHSASYVNGLRGTPQQWAGLVHAMVQNGADLSPQEEKVLSQYLAQTHHQ